MRIKVTVDDARVKAMLKSAPERLHSGVSRLIRAAAINVQREMRIEAPVGVDGVLRRSVDVKETPGSWEAEVSPTAKYADDIEDGRGPHWVSAKEGSPLARWAKFRGLNPFAVQRSIAKKGTKANPFVERTYMKTRDDQERFIASGVERLIVEFNNG